MTTLFFWEARVQNRGLPFSVISWTSDLSLIRIRGRRSFATFVRARMSCRHTSRRLRVGLRGNRSPSLLLLKIPIKTAMFSSWQGKPEGAQKGGKHATHIGRFLEAVAT